MCHYSGVLRIYRLASGSAGTAAPGILRPDDFHASTNARIWTQTL
jgi:hypothetical protein